jgi:predicted RNase H-like nuclease (RuvC/YqgF family)
MAMNVEAEIRDLKRRVSELEGSFGFLSDQVKAVHRDLLAFQEKTEERFERVDQRFDRLEGKVDRLDGRIDGLDRKIDTKVDGLRRDLPGIVGATMRDVLNETRKR